MNRQPPLQETFLTQVRRSQALVTVFLMNGYQLRGTVRGFDPFVVILHTDDKQQMIYKHAISTIIPERAVALEEGAAE